MKSHFRLPRKWSGTLILGSGSVSRLAALAGGESVQVWWEQNVFYSGFLSPFSALLLRCRAGGHMSPPEPFWVH